MAGSNKPSGVPGESPQAAALRQSLGVTPVSTVYTDLVGGVHTTPAGAIAGSLGAEGAMGKGGCGQSPENLSGGHSWGDR